jgi:hypothetical protein
VPLRVLTDEHVTPEVSHRLQAVGYEVACVRDRGLLHCEDWELMRWCIDHEYAICTHNRRHFEREHRHCQARGEVHCGILILEVEWPRDDIYWALRQYLEGDPDPALLKNQVEYLLRASPDFVRERSGPRE